MTNPIQADSGEPGQAEKSPEIDDGGPAFPWGEHGQVLVCVTRSTSDKAKVTAQTNPQRNL